jgi:hypothetical protein
VKTYLHVHFTFLFFLHFLLSFRKNRLPEVHVKILYLVESGLCLRFALFLTRPTETLSLVITFYTLLRDLIFMSFRATLFYYYNNIIVTYFHSSTLCKEKNKELI